MEWNMVLLHDEFRADGIIAIRQHIGAVSKKETVPIGQRQLLIR
jgi:hypothetical protein